MAEGRARYVDFVRRLAEGRTPEATQDQLDALLHWLAGRANAAAVAIDAAFEVHDMPRETARRRTMIYLDATLFAHSQDSYRVFGLTPDCDFSAIRLRHKQLMQVIHPDRHDDNQDWFTERSERINHAYADLKAHHGQRRSRQGPATVTPPSPSAPKTRRPPAATPAATSWQALFANKDRLRRQLKTHLGNSANLEKRVYIVLIAVPVILLVVVYVQQPDLDGLEGEVAVVDATTRTDDGAAGTVAGPRGRDEPAAPRATPGLESASASPRASGGGAAMPTLKAHAAMPFDFDQGVVWTPPFDAGAFETNRVATPATIPRATSVPDAPVPEADKPAAPATVAAIEIDEYPGFIPVPPPGMAAPVAPISAMEAQPDEVPGQPHVDDPDPGAPEGDDQAPHVDATDSAVDREQARGSRDTTEHESTAALDASQGAAEEAKKPQQSQSPETPAQPAQARAPAPGQAEAGKQRPDLAAIKAFLDEYRAAYNTSDTERFTRLFQNSATSKHANNRSKIAEQYESLFNRTRNRNLVFKDVRYQRLSERQYQVETRYVVDWIYPDGEKKTDTGRFEMLLVTEGEDLKIRRLDY